MSQTSKKLYVKFAESINKMDASLACKTKFVDFLCDEFAEDNPRFDRDRFRVAAGVLK